MKTVRPIGFGRILLNEDTAGRVISDPAAMYKIKSPKLAPSGTAADIVFVDGTWRGHIRIPANKSKNLVRCNAWRDRNGDRHWVYQVRSTTQANWGQELGLPKGGVLFQIHRIIDTHEDRVWIVAGLARTGSHSYVGGEDDRVEADSVESESNNMRDTYSADKRSAAIDVNVTVHESSFMEANGIGNSRAVARINCPKVGHDSSWY